MKRAAPADRKTDVTTRLISVFKQLISEGTLVPGARLPSERELAQSLGVARSSLRQALKVLEIMGVISQRVGDGTYLNSGAPSVLSEPLDFLIHLIGISIDELMDARIIVEPELAARAAAHATEDDVAALRQALAAMEQAGEDRLTLVEHDLRFHEAVSQGAGNRVCSLMFSVVHRSMQSLMDTTSQLVDPQHTIGLHRRIFAAIRKRNPEDARLRMAEHLEDAKSLLLRASERSQQTRLQQRISSLSMNGAPEARRAKAPRAPSA